MWLARVFKDLSLVSYELHLCAGDVIAVIAEDPTGDITSAIESHGLLGLGIRLTLSSPHVPQQFILDTTKIERISSKEAHTVVMFKVLH